MEKYNGSWFSVIQMLCGTKGDTATTLMYLPTDERSYSECSKDRDRLEHTVMWIALLIAAAIIILAADWLTPWLYLLLLMLPICAGVGLFILTLRSDERWTNEWIRMGCPSVYTMLGRMDARVSNIP